MLSKTKAKKTNQAAVTEILQRVRGALPGACRVQRETSVVVAWSGGADSTFLTWAMSELAKSDDVRPHAVHIHHGLRAESDDEARHVRTIAKSLGMSLKVVCLNLEPGPGVQQRARQARYAALDAVAKELRCQSVLTGHTLDDQVETVLMRLLRGANVRGLRGILPRTDQGWARPMLGIRHEEVVGTLDQLGIPFVRDPSNQDRAHLRVRVRKDLLPALERLAPGVRERLIAMGGQAQTIWSSVEHLLEGIEAGGALPVQVIHELPSFLHGAVLEKWLKTDLDRHHVKGLVDMAQNSCASSRSAPGGHTVHRVGAHLVAGPRTGRPDLVRAFAGIIPLGDALENCPAPENSPASSRWVPLHLVGGADGRNSRKRVRAISETLRKERIAPSLRPLWPVLVDGASVLGVAGVAATPFPTPAHQESS